MRILTSSVWLVVFLLCGCTSSYILSQSIPPPPSGMATPKLLEVAEQRSETADTKEKLLNAIHTFEQVLIRDPKNYRSLVMAANQYILLGTAYETHRKDKKAAFQKAINYTERAMCTCPEFQRLREQGQPIHVAAQVLPEEQLEAMVFWATAVFYYFDEGLYKIEKFPKHGRLRRARKVLEYAYAMNPDWEGGTLHVSWGIYYLAVPSAIGGCSDKSDEAFEKAIQAGPDYLLPRWSRARYSAVKYKNWPQFQSDLQWVITRKPTEIKDHGAWAAFIQRDSKRLLKKYKDKL